MSPTVSFIIIIVFHCGAVILILLKKQLFRKVEQLGQLLKNFGPTFRENVLLHIM